MRNALLLLACLPLVACGSVPPSPPVPPVPPPSPAAAAAAAPEETRYSFLFAGNPAGSATARAGEGGWWSYTFEFNDRGRGPQLASRVFVDGRGIPTVVETSGHDYWKSPVDERFELADGKAAWKSAAEHGGRDVDGAAFYVSQNSMPQETALLARALLAARGRLDLLPDGQARIERAGSAQVTAGGIGRTVQLYAISGLAFTPSYVWLDAQQGLFALVDGWTVAVREGWEGAVPELVKVQDAAKGAREKALAAKLGKRPEDELAIRHARLFDPATGTVHPDTTVVVLGSRIQAVGPDAEVRVPRRAEVVDAHGRTLLPGLWDMHQHFSADDGLLDLAAGVTTGRDMANDIDFLLDLRRRFDDGEAIGPRVVLAGFIDSPGPYAGPSKVLVDDEAKALAAVDRYAQLGYEQIKLYSSLDPKLVPPIIARAHAKRMRVSGHIPNGLTAEQAVRAGFDEIQHMNFLFLNFLDGVDTRTPARFTAVAAHAAELDLGSRRVRDFIALLKERHTVIDPTLAIFELMFTDRPGEVGRGSLAIADRLPPMVRRGLLAGGLGVPAGMDQRYRDSFRAMLAMLRALHDAGITIEAGTDAMAGFSLHRELELYVEAGIPAPEVLRIATVGAARIMRHDQDLGTIAPGKLADLILVDGEPDVHIADIRRVTLTVKDGVVYDPAALYEAIGVKPAG
jgi:imidazolonepropionase-like amidohydrolase